MKKVVRRDHLDEREVDVLVKSENQITVINLQLHRIRAVLIQICSTDTFGCSRYPEADHFRDKSPA